MQFGRELWIWQQENWTDFRWDEQQISPKLRQCWKLLGELFGSTQGQVLDPKSSLDVLLENILSSSAIEGENLNAFSLRSSLAKRLGVTLENPYPTTDRSEGVSDIMLDALENWQQELTLERLLQWHQWLFPEKSALGKISVGQLRGDEPMQVVSDRLDRPKVHFEAPPRSDLEQGLTNFLTWFNQSRHQTQFDPLLRAGICHLWLLTLHPFDDGNGRITRALTDLALAQADQQTVHLYAISTVILQKRNAYYAILEQSQKGTSDISAWLNWFLDVLQQALQQSLTKIHRTLAKSRFWQMHTQDKLLDAQKKVLNRLLDGGEMGFENGINASQYQKVAKVSKATATRHLTELVEKGLLQKTDAGGRSTRYVVCLD